MERFIGRYSNQVYALMRIVIGATLSLHGAQKLLGFFGGQTPPLFSQFWIGGVIELAGGLQTAQARRGRDRAPVGSLAPALRAMA